MTSVSHLLLPLTLLSHVLIPLHTAVGRRVTESGGDLRGQAITLDGVVKQKLLGFIIT